MFIGLGGILLRPSQMVNSSDVICSLCDLVVTLCWTFLSYCCVKWIGCSIHMALLGKKELYIL